MRFIFNKHGQMRKTLSQTRSAGQLIQVFRSVQLHRAVIPEAKQFSSHNMEHGFQGEEGAVQTAIRTKLNESLKPSHLEVINESNMHNVPKGAETHFKVVVVSDNFEGMPLIKRHRLVMDTLKAEMEGPVHALSIQAKTPAQWDKCGGQVAQSPPCLGGSKR